MVNASAGCRRNTRASRTHPAASNSSELGSLLPCTHRVSLASTENGEPISG